MSAKIKSILYLSLTLLYLTSSLLVLRATTALAAPEYADVPFTNNHAGPIWLSQDGRYVGLSSLSSVNGDGMGGGQFMRDRQVGTTVRTLDLDPNRASMMGMSDDLRFASLFTDVPLLPQDTNGTFDVYVLDRQSNNYELVSVSTSGALGNGVSFSSQSNQTMSADGRFVAFISYATNLAAGTDDNGGADVFIRDRQLGVTTRISSTSEGNSGERESMDITVSRDGSAVAFSTYANSIIGGITDSRQIMRQELSSGAREWVSAPQSGGSARDTSCGRFSISANGRFVAFNCVGPMLPGVLVSHSHIYRFDSDSGRLIFIDSETQPTTSFNEVSINASGNRILFTVDHRMLIWDASSDTDQEIAAGVQGTILSADGMVAAAQELGAGGSRAGVWTLPRVEEPNPDTTAPVVSAFSWSQNPKAITEMATLTVPATDDSLGVTAAEYFIGDIDPGQGNGTQMTIANIQDGGRSVDLLATFESNLPTGVHRISVRAADSARNWSEIATDFLVVYNPETFRMTGRRTIIPSLANGDLLPGLIAANQDDKAIFGFNVRYNNQGNISSGSDLQIKYKTGTRCNNPNQAQNCHNLELNATSIVWLVTQGQNNSTGIFQGMATMVVDGTTSQVLFRVTGVDGERLDPNSLDRFQIEVYPQGAIPDISMPIYRVNAANIQRGNIKIL